MSKKKKDKNVQDKNIVTFEKATKQDFQDYLEKHCSCDNVFESWGILSFAGSDGPKLKDSGFKTGGEQYLYTQPDAIDEYIKDGCVNSYWSYTNGPLPLPEKSYKEYLENKFKN